jgi:hypothetical protein
VAGGDSEGIFILVENSHCNPIFQGFFYFIGDRPLIDSDASNASFRVIKSCLQPHDATTFGRGHLNRMPRHKPQAPRQTPKKEERECLYVDVSPVFLRRRRCSIRGFAVPPSLGQSMCRLSFVLTTTGDISRRRVSDVIISVKIYFISDLKTCNFFS